MSADNDRDFERLMRKDVLDWSVADVGIWVDCIGMQEYKIQFIENDVGGLELLELESPDLTALGVKRVGHRKKILVAIKKLGNQSLESNSRSNTSSNAGSKKAASVHSSESWDSSSVDSTDQNKKVTCKCYYKDDICVIQATTGMSFRRLKSKIRKEFGKRMQLKYQDSDGDKIGLRKDRDWKTALQTAEKGRLRIICTPTKKTNRRAAAKRKELSVLSNLPNPVVMIDQDGVITFFNPAAERFWGYKRSEVVGSKVNMLMPESISKKHDKYLKNYLTTGIAKIVGTGRKVQALKKNGDKADIFLTISETKTRKYRSFVGTIQDLSNTKDEDIVRKDQTSHYTILENILDAAIVINEQGIIQFYNSAAFELLGYKASAVIGRNITLMQQGKDKKEHDQYLQNYLKTGKASVIGTGRDVVAVHKCGDLLPVHLSVSEQKVGSKRLFTGILRPSKLEETSKRTVLEQLREVLDNLLVAAIVIDDHGVIKAFNQSCCDILGYSLVEVVGRNIKMIMTDKDRDAHDGYLKKWRDTGKEHVFGVGRDLVAKKKDGSNIKIRLSVSKRKQEDGKFLCLGTIQPI